MNNTPFLGFFLTLILIMLGDPATVQARPFRPAMYPNGTVIGCAACHVSPSGGGTRTAFGNDVFAIVQGPSSTPFWGPTLAQKDSDGDGYTNGQEVGDPNGIGLATPGWIPTNPGDPLSKPANQAPTVTITRPIDGAQYVAPATLEVDAIASDADGTVVSVEFFSGNVSLGVVSSQPFLLVWTNVAAGNYILMARARDNVGASTDSLPVAITVSAPLEPIRFNAIAREGSLLSLSWTGGRGPFVVQMKTNIQDVVWTDLLTTNATTASVIGQGDRGFIRIRDAGQ